MKITRCFTVMVILLLLSINIAFASPPGKGEITVKSDDAIDRIVVRYNISSLMGEPIINVAYSFYSYTLIRSDIDPAQVLWVKIKDNLISSNYAWIRVDAIPPSLNGPWSDDFTGSPSWDTVLVNGWSDKQSTKYVDAEMAKQFWRNGFQVVGAQLSTKYDKYVSQQPQPVQQPQQPPIQPQKPSPQPMESLEPFVGKWTDYGGEKWIVENIDGQLKVTMFEDSYNHKKNVGEEKLEGKTFSFATYRSKPECSFFREIIIMKLTAAGDMHKYYQFLGSPNQSERVYDGDILRHW